MQETENPYDGILHMLCKQRQIFRDTPDNGKKQKILYAGTYPWTPNNGKNTKVPYIGTYPYIAQIMARIPKSSYNGVNISSLYESTSQDPQQW